tara:strand:+ start:1651 stop:3372 length:1722 start_codon:yes stop_codon:yes gene_type:complete
MKFFIKTIYFIFIIFIALFSANKIASKENKISYKKEDISNYFSGNVFLKNNFNKESYKYLSEVKNLKDKHSNFNILFIRNLILLEKFDEAFEFSKSIWKKEELFFEVDLLLGLESFINKDYVKAKKHFIRLNEITPYNLLFDRLLGNILVSWVNAAEDKREESFVFLSKIPNRYDSIKKIQNAFLYCHFDMPETEMAFRELTEKDKLDFSRYNFFLINYLISKNENEKIDNLIDNMQGSYDSNLLIKEAKNFVLNKNKKKVKNLFSCKNPKDNIAEIFYVIANLYSTEKSYQLSNFYLNISLLLNNSFSPNKALLAENLFYQKKYKLSKQAYKSIKKIGPAFSWYAAKSISTIIFLETEDKKLSIVDLKNNFDLIKKPSFEKYYELANFYKKYDFFKEAVKYYSFALENIDENHDLIPKILDRRGTSYERMGDWDNAEVDLLKSLEILPDQPYVLNYLAYSWTEKEIHIDRAVEMLNEAMKLQVNDGYITDSIGWAYYAKKDYKSAEKFLQRAVELLPLDPTINDHYGDVLWMLNKDIQARYVWKYILGLDDIDEELKDNLSKKIIYGINKKL